MTLEQYRAVEAEVARQIGADLLDATYFCPDAPWEPSTQRKPLPGMVLEAAEEHGSIWRGRFSWATRHRISSAGGGRGRAPYS